MSRIKKYFITGLLVVVPLYLTVYVFILLVGMMDSVFNILPQFLRPHSYLPFNIPGMGLFFTIFGIFVVGVLTQNFAGKKLVSIGEKFLARIPFLRIVYNATKQFMETFLDKGHHGFEDVVLFEYPRKGIYVLGFLTGHTSGELDVVTKGPTVSVFLPTTPNPHSPPLRSVTPSTGHPGSLRPRPASGHSCAGTRRSSHRCSSSSRPSP